MARNLSVIFKNRDFTSRMDPANIKFQVNSYSFGVIGGCKEASITALGGEKELEDILNWLRCPVEIYDPKGVAVWWGYIHSVAVRKDALEIAPTLDSMVNRVAVSYSYVATGTQKVGQRKTTAWASDTDSIAEFGTKEWLSPIDGTSDAGAIARRDAILASQKWPLGGLAASVGFGNPRGRVRYSGHKKSASATINCRGWWETAGWQLYANTGTDSVATTDQISAIVTSDCEFLTATDIEAASGISSSEYRDGEKTAKTEIETLMSQGGANGRRLLSWVDINRRLQIWEEPAASSGVEYFLDSGAVLWKKGGILAPEFAPPVGVWCRLKDVLSGVVDLTKLVDPSLQFIEESRWDANIGPGYSFKGRPGVESVLEVK